VGDSPVIGAGTWADERRAISMTGHGEAVLGHLSAYVIATSAAPLSDACADAITALGPSDAGTIAIDAEGGIALPFNTRIMHRGWWRAGDEPQTRVA
jgi:beta-aspartyl-peptidase (threonine type)